MVIDVAFTPLKIVVIREASKWKRVPQVESVRKETSVCNVINHIYTIGKKEPLMKPEDDD